MVEISATKTLEGFTEAVRLGGYTLRETSGENMFVELYPNGCVCLRCNGTSLKRWLCEVKTATKVLKTRKTTNGFVCFGVHAVELQKIVTNTDEEVSLAFSILG